MKMPSAKPPGEAAVARGIAAGLIDVEQVPTELKAKIEHMIGFFKENF